MSNQKVFISRIISATEKEWEGLSQHLFKNKIRVPLEPFDYHKYSNSKASLQNLKANSFRKLTYDLQVRFFVKLAHEIGLDFHASKDGAIQIQYNKTLVDSDTNYGVFLHVLKQNQPKETEEVVEQVETA